MLSVRDLKNTNNFGLLTQKFNVYAWWSSDLYLVNYTQRHITFARYQYRLYIVTVYLDFSFFPFFFQFKFYLQKF